MKRIVFTFPVGVFFFAAGENGKSLAADWTSEELCNDATFMGRWSENPRNKSRVEEAKSRGLKCGISETEFSRDVADWISEELCNEATFMGRWSENPRNKSRVEEAKRRGLSCGVEEPTLAEIASKETKVSSYAEFPGFFVFKLRKPGTFARTGIGLTFAPTNSAKNNIEKHQATLRLELQNIFAELNIEELTGVDGEILQAEKAQLTRKILYKLNNRLRALTGFGNIKRVHFKSFELLGAERNSTNKLAIVQPKQNDSQQAEVISENRSYICDKATTFDGKWTDDVQLQDFVKEAKNLGLTCGVIETMGNQIASTIASSLPNSSSAELIAAQKEAEKLRREIVALKAQQAAEQQRVDADTQIPLITASSRRDSDTNALITGTVTDNIDVADVTIDGEPVRRGSDGSFKTSIYVPREGKIVEIVAFDRKGNKATKSIQLERGAIQQAIGPVFANLNPSGNRVAPNKDALALIIGVADYERTPAKAAYADRDAQTFYDYAMLKLGVPAGNIKELVNVDANRIDVSLAIKDWIARTTKQGESDVYIFFAGHGLADQSGLEMYLLPHDGEPRLLSDSAISRNELFQDIASANPRSVTVFLDTCYSGTTRGTDMLVASRPIAIRAKQQNIPDGFTVFTAAGGDQTAKPLEEAKHGMFSYFLMKGMEGDADANNDNQITAGELHAYVEQNVVQQSSGSQTPELQGDRDRVLVRFQ